MARKKKEKGEGEEEEEEKKHGSDKHVFSHQNVFKTMFLTRDTHFMPNQQG